MTHEYRQPTIQEAVDWLMQAITKEYRQLCIAFWREHYGNAYAERVKQEFLTKREGKK